MSQAKFYLALLTSCTLSAALTASSAMATLGEHESSIEHNRSALKATTKITAHEKYSVHTLKTSNSTIHQYVTTDGTVFAVTWRGMKRPDLEVLLGANYAEYKAQADSQPQAPGRHSTTVETSHIKVQRGGHMRDLHGKAYAPDLVPAGIEVENLQ